MRWLTRLGALVVALALMLVFCEAVSVVDPHFWLPCAFALLLAAILGKASSKLSQSFLFSLWFALSSACASAWVLGSQGSRGGVGSRLIEFLVLGGVMCSAFGILGCFIAALRNGLQKGVPALWAMPIVLTASSEMFICGRALRSHSIEMQFLVGSRAHLSVVSTAEWYKGGIQALACVASVWLVARSARAAKSPFSTQLLVGSFTTLSFLVAQAIAQLLVVGIEPLPLAITALVGLAGTILSARRTTKVRRQPVQC